MPYRRIAMRKLGHACLGQPQFDTPQHGLDRATGELPRRDQSGAAFRIIAQIVGELGARMAMTQAAGLIDDHWVDSLTILETRQILKIRAGHAVSERALQGQGNSLPHAEISCITLGRCVAPLGVGKGRSGCGSGQMEGVMSHCGPIVQRPCKRSTLSQPCNSVLRKVGPASMPDVTAVLY
jgi:hypothetical protein